jgi:secretion monitor
MVAAGLGLPHAGSERTTLPETASRSLNISSAARFDSLALLHESARRPNFNVDYWHQHAIRTVIRHLSFTLTPARQPTAERVIPLEVQKLALLDTLNALLTHEARPPTIIRQTTRRQVAAKTQYQTGLWLAQVQGIRAGPRTLA